MFLIFKNQKFRKLEQIITFCEIFVCIWRKSPEYNLRQRISLHLLKTYVNVMRYGLVYAILNQLTSNLSQFRDANGLIYQKRKK